MALCSLAVFGWDGGGVACPALVSAAFSAWLKMKLPQVSHLKAICNIKAGLAVWVLGSLMLKIKSLKSEK